MQVSFGGLIADKRRERGDTQEEFALRARISRTYLSMIERNDDTGGLGVDILARLAIAASVDFHDLVNAYLVQYYPHEARLLKEAAPQKG